jgi:cobalt-zinc-cadmium efflux system outer membrane protein
MDRTSGERRRPHKKPTQARFFFATVLGLALPTASAGAQPPAELDEADVVERALARPWVEGAIEGAVAREEGRARTAGAYANPEVSYVREQTFGDGGTGEDYVTLSQELDLGNVRGLRADAFDARAHAARRDGESLRLAIAADARGRFYAVVYREERTGALGAWLARIDEALAIVVHREAGGDAALYDRRRLERERALAAARLSAERGSLERDRGRLAAILGVDRCPPVRGSLAPESAPPELATLHRTAARRPDLDALALRLEAASLTEEAGSRSWIPVLRLEAGWKGVDLGGQRRLDGFLAGATLTLPLWDHGAGAALEAAGDARATAAEREQRLSEIEGELAGVRGEAVALAEAALELRERAAEHDLVAIAAAGYHGGELGLLELLDAYRSALDDALTVLDLELAARRSRIELDRMTGRGLP